MGYDVTRFQGEVDEDLLCPICSGVLEEPVQVRAAFSDPTTLIQTSSVFHFFLFIYFFSIVCYYFFSLLMFHMRV